MSKRKYSNTSPIISKRFKETFPHPFGFDITHIIAKICHKSTMGKVSHQISNYIEYFNKYNEPVFQKPHKVWKVEEIFLEVKEIFLKSKEELSQKYLIH